MSQNSKQDQKQASVTVEVPIELLFCGLDIFATNEYKEFDNITRQWIEHHFRYTEISLARLTPHINLFEHFMGNKKVDPSEYLDWYSKLYETRNLKVPLSSSEILMKRYREYIHMKNELEADTNFFKDHPPIVQYNSKGLFNLQDGHHRAVFLLCSGKRKIFVEMDANDYNKWINEEYSKNVAKIIQLQDRKLFYTPILYPTFNNINIERDKNYPTRLELILKYLGSRNLRGVKVVDIGCNIGYYARHFAREGAIVTGIEPNPYHYKLLEEVNRLENVYFEVIKEPFEICSLQPYNIGILLAVFYHVMKDIKIRDAFLKQIDNSILEMLFWESGDEIEIEKKIILENTSFYCYKKLGSTFGTGKVRELGVFLRRT